MRPACVDVASSCIGIGSPGGPVHGQAVSNCRRSDSQPHIQIRAKGREILSQVVAGSCKNIAEITRRPFPTDQ